MTVTYYTYKRSALAVKRAWQKIRFATGKGYYLTGSTPERITMYDSVDVSQIPADAAAVAGYAGGRWPTYPLLLARFPHALRLSIAVTASEVAECLDVEAGDAANADAPAWVQRQIWRGVKRPVVYSSLSNWPALEATLNAAGIRTRRKLLFKPQIRRWTAHYTYKAHLCNASCGFGFTGTADATQYTDKALGRNLDASLCSPTFFSSSV